MAWIKRLKLTDEERAWVIYDWANSAFILIVGTILFTIFFRKQIAPNEIIEKATSYIGYANASVALLLVFLAPVFGTFADGRGRKKRFWILFVIIGVLFTLGLALIQKGQWILALVFYVVASLGYTGANVFYDAFITDVTEEERMDRVSSAGYAWGYIGSTIPAIFGIAVMLHPNLIGLAKDDYLSAMRLVFVLTAFWWLLFSIPMALRVKQKYFVIPTTIKQNFVRLFNTFREIKKNKQAFLFLIAFFFYIDGVHTIISMATAFGMEWGIGSDVLMKLILVIQFVAFPFAIIYGRLAKRFSAKAMLFTGIVIYTFIVLIAFFIPSFKEISTRTTMFWILGILVGTSQGGVQALSRSVFGKLIPKENSGKFFGFFNIFGKFASFLGPLMIGLIATSPGRTRWAVLSLLIFFLIGAILLGMLHVEKNKKSSV